MMRETVSEFYRDGRVLVTGGTGFVGKALVEKLLRACPGIQALYLLVRAKRGQSPEQRIKALLDSHVFDRVRDENLLSKVIAVAGDVMEPGLGLSEADRQMLISQVTVVFHSAATVKFNETLQEAVRLNTLGTQAVLDLCSQMISLRAVIHVSTAYSNASRKEVGEEVYEAGGADAVLQLARSNCPSLHPLPEPLCKELEAQRHPNTYTVTKCLAETLVARKASSLPIAIVRPSIVTGAWEEPYPGWIDNISGITGIMVEIGRGTIRSIICNDRYIVDIIPVDIVVDTLIVAAWHVAHFRKGSKVMVYNCTSGSLNPLTWAELGKLSLSAAWEYPSRYTQWPPGFSFTTSRLLHAIKDTVFHSLPAFLVDIVLQLQGSKPIMLKMCRRTRLAAQTGEFFALHEWKFRCENQASLYHSLGDSDKKIFNTDVGPLKWAEYVPQYMKGIRSYVLKDTEGTLPAAKKKLNRLYWCLRFTQFFFLLFLVKLVVFR